MEAASVALGIVPVVVEIYKAVEAAYDLYLKIRDFPSTFEELHICLQIERYRLTLWGAHMLSEHQQEALKTSQSDLKLWRLFYSIFQKILGAFNEAGQIVGVYGDEKLFAGSS